MENKPAVFRKYIHHNVQSLFWSRAMCLSTWNSSNIKKLLAGFSWCRMLFFSRCCCNQHCWEAVLSAGRTRKTGCCHSWCWFPPEQSDVVELKVTLICQVRAGFLLLGKHLLQFLDLEDLLISCMEDLSSISCAYLRTLCCSNRFPSTLSC